MAIWQWSKVPANNATADPDINLRDNQAPSVVKTNNRTVMADVAAWRDDISGSILTTGTSTAYLVATNQVFTTLPNGFMISFRPHVTNGVATTLNVDGQGVIPLRSETGMALGAGTLVAGTPYSATYFSATNEFVLEGFFGNPYAVPVGGLLDFVSATPPNSNFVLPYGQAISRTTYAALFLLCGSTYGAGDGSTTFNVPDLRGRVSVAPDNMGGAPANRITTAGSGVDGSTVGAAGGGQNVTMDRANLPNVTLTLTTSTDGNHTHTVSSTSGGFLPMSFKTGSGSLDINSGGGATAQALQADAAGSHAHTGNTSSLNGNVTQTAMRLLQPSIMMPKLLRVI